MGIAARAAFIVLGGASVVLLGVASDAPGAVASKGFGGPFVSRGGTEAGGYPLAGGGPSGTRVRFIDRGTFSVGILLQNASGRTVSIVGAHTPEPSGSLVRQVGARFAPFTPCRGNLACPFLADARHPPSPHPVTLSRGAMVGVKLSYRLVSCGAARSSTTVSGQSLVVTYRYGNRPVERQTLPLGGAKLLLDRPEGVEGLPRPFSHIGLVRSCTT